MKYEMAKTKNVVKFLTAVKALEDRPLGMEGMGLLYGRPGEGKSTVVAYAVNAKEGVFLRANACWTVTTLLGALVKELGFAPQTKRAPMLEAAGRSLIDRPRPLFIDEADYLLRRVEMLDTLRDLYDHTGVPVVLIGMEEMARKIAANGRFQRRIGEWVEFSGIDFEDARCLANTVCEVAVADDLVAHLLEASKANIGLMMVGLSRIEALGRAGNLERVDHHTWGKRELFYGQPSFRIVRTYRTRPRAETLPQGREARG